RSITPVTMRNRATASRIHSRTGESRDCDRGGGGRSSVVAISKFAAAKNERRGEEEDRDGERPLTDRFGRAPLARKGRAEVRLGEQVLLQGQTEPREPLAVEPGADARNGGHEDREEEIAEHVSPAGEKRREEKEDRGDENAVEERDDESAGQRL